MASSDLVERPRAPQLRLYPERPDPRPGKLDGVLHAIEAAIVAPLARRRGRDLFRIVPRVRTRAAELTETPLPMLQQLVRASAIDVRRSDFKDEVAIAETFALLRELSGRTLGKRHHDVQLVGAFAILSGTIAEMATGEGKTLTAGLAAAAIALAGTPVHVVTVNDYLARRDAELIMPLFRAVGLTVGIVVEGMELADRQQAYAADITYCTNKELAFDYLRDRMVLGQQSGDLRLRLSALGGRSARLGELRLRGLHFALVDEADSVLVDEARTPLVISGSAKAENDPSVIAAALDIARGLAAERHYRVLADERRIQLTPVGRNEVEALTRELGAPWKSRVMREELVRQALSALLLFHRDEHYVVREGKVMIVDPSTGRRSKDRSWSDGLHQMIETKEELELSDQRVTIARMTYQRFFRRYGRLAGMTGTASHVAGELWRVYRLPVATIPTHRPSRRSYRPDRVLSDEESKWQAIIARTIELHKVGAPVLIGTGSVAASEQAGRRLLAAGLVHEVLNAQQDMHEAAIVARAGEVGRITVVTSMAGRGTDIPLGPGAADVGGLHVIMSERHEARRIDDQLAGRAGRQGEPGHVEAILSLEDAILATDAPPWLRRVAASLSASFGDTGRRLAIRLAQKHAERLHARMRMALLKSDRNTQKTLAFAGRAE
ncbi:MAG: prepilin peptidase [Devosia sp.]|nr:prepilin peptidase [Devosia sp.]